MKKIESKTKNGGIDVLKFQASKDKIVQSTKIEATLRFKIGRNILPELKNNQAILKQSREHLIKLRLKNKLDKIIHGTRKATGHEKSSPSTLKKSVLWRTPLNKNAVGRKKAVAAIEKFEEKRDNFILDEEVGLVT